ncbi:MAG: hypothetical protein LBM73_01450, partial [Candidatus Nomurabacteria bacterium]|nr:hypothetical protein [Candidatus Nomurabacteria bacterium]
MSSIKKFIKIGALSLASVAVIGAGGFFLLNRHNPKVNATLAGWNAGNIMSDYVMSNKNAMNESQIQSFLKSKNPCNNTDISEAAKYPSVSYHIENGHFVCMADETFNGESAAHVIWQAAQDYSINPEVLIVLLQKEQGLVTDTWPNSNQYRSATGFGCPDTSVCQSQYYGFKNQIRQAANLFHSVLTGGWSNYPIGIHYIQYSPNAACGGSNVNIQNRATSALYRYTPYQPNAAALASGYGGGATCGAYGNRNFYNYFTDWFGSTRSAVVVPQNQAVWRLWNPTLQAHFMTASANEADIYLASGWQSDGIKAHTVKTGGQNVYRLYNPYTSDHYYTTSTAQVNEYVRAGWLNDGVVFKAATNGNPVWQLWNGKTHFITDSLSEVHTYVAGGWAIDGVKFYEATTALNSVWQLQRGTDAVLTTNVGELMQYMRFGYQVVATFSYDPSGQNVYRLYNPYTSDHYYTTSTAQVNEYVRAGWLNDGV